MVIVGVAVVGVNRGRIGVVGGCADFEGQEVSVCRGVRCMMTESEGRCASELVLFIIREWLSRG